MRQAELQQRIEQPMLGELDLAPMEEIFRVCDVGDSAIMPAGRAKHFPLLARNEPVADIMASIGAKAIKPVRRRQRMPRTVCFPQGGNDLLFRQIAQPQPAALARRILEIERLTAILAFKKLHYQTTDDRRRSTESVVCPPSSVLG